MGFGDLHPVIMPVRSMLILPGAVVLLLAASVPSHGIELEAGTWKEVETGTEDGKPVQPSFNTTCITPDEAHDPAQGLSPTKNLTGMRGQCKTLENKKSDTSLSMHVQCGDPAKVLRDFNVDYVFNNARSYSGTVRSAVTVSGKSSTSDKKVEGRWMSSICRRNRADSPRG
jgi:hypothetical protein